MFLDAGYRNLVSDIQIKLWDNEHEEKIMVGNQDEGLFVKVLV